MAFSDDSSLEIIKNNLITLLDMTRDAYLTTTLYHNEHGELISLLPAFVLYE